MLNALRDQAKPRQIFFALLVLTLAFRLWLAAVFPITGDEAYFIWWGQIPDWGFYDHPPMIGWWLALLLKVSSAEWWLRLPVLIQPAILGVAVAAFLRPRGEVVAWSAASLVMLAPVNVWNVFITTDTPLIYFSVFSGLAWLQARRAEDAGHSPWSWYALAGVFLAGAVLSKYFAALLGFAYLVDTVVRPSRRKFAGLALVYFLVVPGLALMAWWNASHCWANVMFNFYNRHGDAGWSWKTPLLYLGMLLYMLTPIWFYLLARHRAVVCSAVRSPTQRGEGKALVVLALIPLALFAVLSLLKQIGLHWVLSFIPFALILLVYSLVESAWLSRLVRIFAGIALVHLLAFVLIAALPLETWKKTSWYDGIVLTFESQKVLAELKPYDDYTWMMDGYSNAVTLGYNTFAMNKGGADNGSVGNESTSKSAPRYIGVFGEASSHARHDDILTDFLALDGRNILILRKSPAAQGQYAPFFERTEEKTFVIRGVTFYLTLGQGFHYSHYRDQVLANVKRKYYAIPPVLPQTACYFCERYFPGEACVKNAPKN